MEESVNYLVELSYCILEKKKEPPKRLYYFDAFGLRDMSVPPKITDLPLFS